MILEHIAIDDIKKYENNTRTHSASQISKLCSAIQEYGFTNPILVDENNELIAGHGRLQAARLLDMSVVPAIRLSNLSENQKKALRISDNRIALESGWDENLLRIELQDLSLDGFDLKTTGFNLDEIENLLQDLEPVNEKHIQTINEDTPRYNSNDSTVSVENQNIPKPFKEVNQMQLAHRCPRCGFEFD